MDTYPQSNDSSYHEFVLAELKYIDCLIQCKYLSAFIGTFSRLLLVKNKLMLELFNFYGICYLFK